MEFVARLRASLAGDGRGRRMVVIAAGLALVVLIGYTLAALTWLAVEGVSTAATPLAGTASVAGPARRQFTPEMANDWTLFGDAAAPVAATGQATPETNLSLQLLGTFSAGDARLSGAVIAERGKDGELYRVGASLPGGATLEKVEKDQVLLRRRGQLEALRFEEAMTTGSVATPPATGLDMAGGFRSLKERLVRPPADENPADEAPARKLDQYMADLKTRPEAVLGDLGLKPATSGGYVVGDGASADIMRNLGLRPGDIVLSVNGKSLGNVQVDSRMIDEVKASGEARVEIKRGSQTFTVNYPL